MGPKNSNNSVTVEEELCNLRGGGGAETFL